LNVCTHPLNNVFKREYREYFGKSREDSIPNINDFIDDPPPVFDEWDYDATHREYENSRFWRKFTEKYF
jgi:hypothetical protein